MAFIKTLKTKGIEASYWIITGYNPNKATNTTAIDMRLYVNKEAREESLENHLESVTLFVEGFGLTIEEMYNLAKESNCRFDTTEQGEEGDTVATPFFSDAVSDEPAPEVDTPEQ